MPSRTNATLRWQLLRQLLLPKADCPGNQELAQISRRPNGYFGLITSEKMENLEIDKVQEKEAGSIIVKYCLPANPVVDLFLMQRQEKRLCHSDFSYAKEHQIDMTGLVGLWPAEEVLTFFCISNPSFFRNKRVLELGSGYGLGGLAVAACAEAAAVTLTDGNPQIVQYVDSNVQRNATSFGDTKVESLLLHWCDEVPAIFKHSIDIVIAADCTFFSDSHSALARSVKNLLSKSPDSQALFFNPQRDGSLERFLKTAKGMGLDVELKEQYDAVIWSIHQSLIKGETSGWRNYDLDHCYPLLAVLTHAKG